MNTVRGPESLPPLLPIGMRTRLAAVATGALLALTAGAAPPPQERGPEALVEIMDEADVQRTIALGTTCRLEEITDGGVGPYQDAQDLTPSQRHLVTAKITVSASPLARTFERTFPGGYTRRTLVALSRSPGVVSATGIYIPVNKAYGGAPVPGAPLGAVHEYSFHPLAPAAPGTEVRPEVTTEVYRQNTEGNDFIKMVGITSCDSVIQAGRVDRTVVWRQAPTPPQLPTYNEMTVGTLLPHIR